MFKKSTIWFKTTLTVLLLATGIFAYWPRSQGTWPDGLRGYLHTTELNPAENSWTCDFSTTDGYDQVYAIVGAWESNSTTFVDYDDANGRLVIGGQRFYDHDIVIWKFIAPDGNTFAGGTVTLDAMISPMLTNAAYLGVSTELDLSGFESATGFSGYNADDFTKVYFSQVDTPQQLQIAVPAGTDTFYVAAARENTTTGYTQLFAYNVSVDAQLTDTYGINVLTTWDDDPFWFYNDLATPAQLQVKATGDTAAQLAYWQLLNEHTQAVYTGFQSFGSSSIAAIDLRHITSGYYTFSVYDSADRLTALDTQRIVIFPQQYYPTTPDTNIHGIHGANIDLAPKLGAKWGFTTSQWAWDQASPTSPIDLGNLRQWIIDNNNAGMRMVVHVNTAPGWAHPNNGDKGAVYPPEPAYYSYWQAYNQAVAQECLGTDVWFESWNEVNNPSGFPVSDPWDTDIQKKLGKEIQQQQYLGLTAGDPQAKLLGACFAGIPSSWYASWYQDPCNCLNYQNGMSGHPYPKAYNSEGYAHVRPPEPTLVPQLLACRQAMDDGGGADQPMSFTEYGFDIEKGCSLDQQARYTARQLAIFCAYREQCNIISTHYFNWSGFVSQYGMFDIDEVMPGDHRARPIVGAFATSAMLLGGCSLVERISDYPAATRAYLFQRGQERTYALWKTDPIWAEGGPQPPEVDPAGDTPYLIPNVPLQTMARHGVMGDKSLVLIDPTVAVNLPANYDPFYLTYHTQPYIDTTQDTLVINVEQGLGATASLTVGNIGQGGTVQLTVTSDASWLMPAGGTIVLSPAAGPTDIPLTLDTAALPAGQYTATLTLTDTAGLADPVQRSVAVILNVVIRTVSLNPQTETAYQNTILLDAGDTTLWNVNTPHQAFLDKLWHVAGATVDSVTWTTQQGDERPLALNGADENAVTWRFKAPADKMFTAGNIILQASANEPGVPLTVYLTSSFATDGFGSFVPHQAGTIYQTVTLNVDAAWQWKEWPIELPFGLSHGYLTVVKPPTDPGVIVAVNQVRSANIAIAGEGVILIEDQLGDIDDFSVGDAVDTITYRSSAISTWLSGKTSCDFDQSIGNSAIGFTHQFDLAANAVILHASLELHLQQSQTGPYNDKLYLDSSTELDANGSYASVRLIDYDYWGDGTVVQIDLANLQARDAGDNQIVVSLLDALYDGQLNVAIEDDSVLDYAVLRITAAQQLSEQLGDRDDYHPGDAADSITYRSAAVTGWLSSRDSRDFDQALDNQAMGYTHQLAMQPQHRVIAATLELRLTSSASGAWSEELFLDGSTELDPAGSYLRIRPSDYDYLGSDTVLLLDLTQLQVRLGDNLLQSIDISDQLADGELDVCFQDDSQIDYSLLTVTVVEDQPDNCAQVWLYGLGMPADFDEDCYVDMVDLALFTAQWLNPDCQLPACQKVDIAPNGQVDLYDYRQFQQSWLGCNDPADPSCN